MISFPRTATFIVSLIPKAGAIKDVINDRESKKKLRTAAATILCLLHQERSVVDFFSFKRRSLVWESSPSIKGLAILAAASFPNITGTASFGLPLSSRTLRFLTFGKESRDMTGFGEGRYFIDYKFILLDQNMEGIHDLSPLQIWRQRSFSSILKDFCSLPGLG
jgi:hypothetical protein